MARRLQTNANGALTFTELVWDDDEEDVSHPLIRIAELYKRDGVVLDTAERTPSWLYVNINELGLRSEEHTSELQSRDSISYAVFCLKKKN